MYAAAGEGLFQFFEQGIGLFPRQIALEQDHSPVAGDPLGGGHGVDGGAVAVDGVAGEAAHGLVLQQPVHHGVRYRRGYYQG